MSRKKRKRNDFLNDDISIGKDEELSLSLGSIFKSEGVNHGDTARRNEIQDKIETVNDKKEMTKLLKDLPKALLRRRRSGFGGKTVTELSLPKEFKIDLEALAKDMKKALGCGSRVEGESIILQGDISDRAEEWLYKKGVKKVQTN